MITVMAYEFVDEKDKADDFSQYEYELDEDIEELD